MELVGQLAAAARGDLEGRAQGRMEIMGPGYWQGEEDQSWDKRREEERGDRDEGEAE